MCSLRVLRSVKLLSQCSHWCGFSPVWVFKCVVRWLFHENALSQRVHLKGLTSLWITTCCLRLRSRVNDLPHTSQVYGFMPLWTFIWSINFSLILNTLPQSKHFNSFFCFSTLWILRTCCFSRSMVAYALPQSWHTYGLSDAWMFIMWLRKQAILSNVLPHSSHLKIGITPEINTTYHITEIDLIWR